MIKVETDFPIADCNDSLFPHGAKNDNNTSVELIQEIRGYFKSVPSILDLGCAGGQFIVDCLNTDLCYWAVGLDGSDYNIKIKHPNWKLYGGENLFTCDISRPFNIVNDYDTDCNSSSENPLKFDLISAWEVIEHIKFNSLKIFFDNIYKHLKLGGIFIGSISTVPDVVNGISYHHTVFSEDYWKTVLLKSRPDGLLNHGLELIDYPFKAKVRDIATSFCIGLRKYE